MCGLGINPAGQREGWWAMLPLPCAIDFNNDGRVSVDDFLTYLQL